MNAPSLRHAWRTHLDTHPGARTLEVAQALGVSEGELLFSRVGDDATLLRPDWVGLVQALPELGEIMALTRNAHVVHEVIGPYETVRAHPAMAGVFGAIEQRLPLSRWSLGIAAPVDGRRRTLHSLQFFDGNGQAVLKIYAREGTDEAAWKALVERFAEDEPPAEVPLSPVQPRTDRPDAEVDAPALREAWAAMTDTHQAHPLLRDHDVGREQALRLLGATWATPVHPVDTLSSLLDRAAADDEKIMIFVGNTGSIQIYQGLVRRVMWRGDWLNVLDPGFNLHVRTTGLVRAWVVRKPTDRGLVRSLEVFDDTGALAVQVFGKRTEDRSKADSWRALIEDLERDHAVESGPA